jgi:hypothetical protein
MSDYQLKVFEPYEKGDWAGKYRIAVIDSSNFKGYPANFVCLLPKALEKGKPGSVFERLFGDKSSEYAIELLKEALKQAQDEQVKTEIVRRLRLFEAKKLKLVCSSCREEFEEYTRTRYKRNLCRNCLETKRLLNQVR